VGVNKNQLLCLPLESISSLVLTYNGVLRLGLGNCNIDFLNFHHPQVWNFKISNLFKWNWNFAVIFWKYRKHNQKSTKYLATSQKSNVIPLKFFEMSLASWNLVNYYKISKPLIKFSKSQKDLRKILLKWLGKTVKYWPNFVNFHLCTENGWKLANFCP